MPVQDHRIQPSLLHFDRAVCRLLIALVVLGVTQSVTAQEVLNVQWTTYLGGSGDDQMRDLCVDNADNVYVCGVFTSGDFPSPTNVPTRTSYLHREFKTGHFCTKNCLSVRPKSNF